MTKLIHEYVWAVGNSLDDCHVLGIRYDDDVGRDRDSSDAYVLQIANGTMSVLDQRQGWYSGLWRSPSGGVYVSSERTVSMKVAPGNGNWRITTFDAILAGIWGLDDNFVLAWGLGLAPDTYVMFLWDGTRWTEMAAPGFVRAICGLSRDLIYAVGDGMISRWDGSRWNNVPSPCDDIIGSIHTESADEMYASCGNGMLLEGTIHGWSELLKTDERLPCVTKMRGKILVGAVLSGLMQVEKRVLEPLVPELFPRNFDHRAGLLMACGDRLAYSADGKNYAQTGTKQFELLTRAIRPFWFSEFQEIDDSNGSP